MKLPPSLRTESKYTSYQLYRIYLALKLHFNSSSYDLFKYNGKVSASEQSFDGRRDKFKFVKLAKHKDPVGVMLANFLHNKGFWIGSIDDPESERVYKEWLKKQESMSYMFSQELKIFEGKNIGDLIDVPDHQHPLLLSKYLRGEISLETLTILQQIVNFIPYWNDCIADPVLWADTCMLMRKYLPFLEYSSDAFKTTFRQYVEE